MDYFEQFCAISKIPMVLIKENIFLPYNFSMGSGKHLKVPDLKVEIIVICLSIIAVSHVRNNTNSFKAF